MQTKTQRLLLRGGLIVLAAVLVSTVGAWAGDTTTDADRAPASGPELLGELRSLRQQLDAKQGELEVARLQLDRVDAIMQYSTHYKLPADMATAVYDVALSEGIDPGLAFRLVKVESGFNPRAVSHVGAIGLTQVLPSTARLYEPGLTTQQLYDRDTNLRIGFRTASPKPNDGAVMRSSRSTMARRPANSDAEWRPVAISRARILRTNRASYRRLVTVDTGLPMTAAISSYDSCCP